MYIKRFVVLFTGAHLVFLGCVSLLVVTANDNLVEVITVVGHIITVTFVVTFAFNVVEFAAIVALVMTGTMMV